MSNVQVSDIILIKRKNSLKDVVSKRLVNSHHMFLVLSVNSNKLGVSIISSQMRKVCSRFPFNIPLMDWSSEGLDKPSFVCLDTKGYVSRNDVYKVVGRISTDDLSRVTSKLPKVKVRKIIEAVSKSSGLCYDDWGSVDKDELKNFVVSKDSDSVAKKIFLKVDSDWREHPDYGLSYPIADKKGNIYRYGLSSAKTYAEANNERGVLNKLKKLYKEFNLEWSEPS